MRLFSGMMLTRTVSRLRMDLRTTVTLSRLPSLPQRLKERSQLMTRPSLRELSMRLFSGLTPIFLQRRKSSRRSRRHLRQLLCQSFRQWEEQELLQEVCQTWEELHQVELRQLMIQLTDQLLRRSIKRCTTNFAIPCL